MVVVDMEEGYSEFFVWIDWLNKVISFREVNGYEKKRFQTHDAMLNYVIERSSAGFRIQ